MSNVTVTPIGHCKATDTPNTNWYFCPNVGAAYFYAILYALSLVAHIAQGIIYRKGYSWVIAMGALWELLAYIFRILSINHPANVSWYSAWFVVILLAPLWINAYVYMVLGRMVYNFTANAKILGVKAWRFGLYFVLLDIAAFLVQAAGASMASGNNITTTQIENALHIYMGGVGLQEAFILCFLGLAFRFQRQMSRETPIQDKPRATQLLYTVYAALTLITIRIIFRLIEYSKGINSSIPRHEAYQYVFDSTLMLFALILFNIFHPGRLMPGKEADFPSRKQRKAAGKNGVMGRAAAGAGGNVLPLYERSGDDESGFAGNESGGKGDGNGNVNGVGG
ncbi:hypothetical protein JMJ35_007194 [Cladonia borealis]|uniref:RTA1 domain protein n=1 Tax=Cladonia borealis TaxID=184061 RepID=A0AA39V0C4_9LECA|nr:hypothetical protein JMJ35_007194 [Cladonia borealis]